jgi:hypothetical protein
VKSGVIRPAEEPPVPEVPSNYQTAVRVRLSILANAVCSPFWLPYPIRASPLSHPSPSPLESELIGPAQDGRVRRATGIVSTICDDRGDEPTYAGVPISELIESGVRFLRSSLSVISTTCCVSICVCVVSCPFAIHNWIFHCPPFSVFCCHMLLAMFSAIRTSAGGHRRCDCAAVVQAAAAQVRDALHRPLHHPHGRPRALRLRRPQHHRRRPRGQGPPPPLCLFMIVLPDRSSTCMCACVS